MPEPSILYFAGIFDTDTEGNMHYSIMTTGPNAEMNKLHDRMPAILKNGSKEVWLSAKSDGTELLADLLTPLPDNSLRMYQVSKQVNTVKNNNGDLIKPINSL